MEPAITIVSYMWGARDTWLKHQAECVCPFTALAEEVLNQLPVAVYMEIVETDDGPLSVFLQQTRAEWDDLIGPEVVRANIDAEVNALMAASSDLISRSAYLSSLIPSNE